MKFGRYTLLLRCSFFFTGPTHHVTHSLEISNVLILAKVSRYDFERRQRPQLLEHEFKTYLSLKGSNYDGLLERHHQHHKELNELVDYLRSIGSKVEVVEKNEFTEEKISRADLILTAGGDGSFLLGASLVMGSHKPVVGLNTDPFRSVGYLCLPNKSNSSVVTTIQPFLLGKFRWLWRQRISILVGQNDYSNCIRHASSIYKDSVCPDEYILENERCIRHAHQHVSSMDASAEVSMEEDCSYQRYGAKMDNLENFSMLKPLPYLALNEVYIGERHSARVSYFEFMVNGCDPPQKRKSSGVILCTGTGSTSWNASVNQLSESSVELLLDLVARIRESEGMECFKSQKLPQPQQQQRLDVDGDRLLSMSVRDRDGFILRVTEAYNSSFHFSPEEPIIGFTVRDPVSRGVYRQSKSRGFANSVVIRSRMWDAHLVVDGVTCIPFNDGVLAKFEVDPKNALRCVLLT